ncbi:MAG: hypothetical protein NTW19_20725 [Planctomycetota bacterium]|nr:hypothetical protein [Planctomycetota bacterium]
MKPHAALALASILILVLTAPGCSSWKRADASVGLALIPNVDTVKVDGRPLIRVRGKRSAIMIDAHGGTIVDYHPQDRPTWFWEPDPKEADRSRQHFVEGARGPNLLQSPGWTTSTLPPRAALDQGDCWQVDGTFGQITLLSDTVDGLRWRRTYRVADTGDVWITVELQNPGHVAGPIGASSTLAGGGIFAPSTLAGTQPGQGPHEQKWTDGYWFSRELTSSPPNAEFTFRAAERGTKNLVVLKWTEHWWFTKAASATQPAGPPPTTTKAPAE